MASIVKFYKTKDYCFCISDQRIAYKLNYTLFTKNKYLSIKLNPDEFFKLELTQQFQECVKNTILTRTELYLEFVKYIDIEKDLLNLGPIKLQFIKKYLLKQINECITDIDMYSLVYSDPTLSFIEHKYKITHRYNPDLANLQHNLEELHTLCFFNA